MDTFYEPLLQMETFAQIEEALKKMRVLRWSLAAWTLRKPI